MKLTVEAVATAQLLCNLAFARASSCQPSRIYKGADLLSMDPAYETFMMSQLDYWSTTSQPPSLVATKDNIYKSFFNCTTDSQLVLEHWCACGIVDIINTTTGAKTGEKCIVPCPTTAIVEGGSNATGSKPGSSSFLAVLTAVVGAAVLFAAGLL